MRFNYALLALAATTASAGFGFGSQRPLGDAAPAENEVPGENPLEFCENPSDYILDIQKVDLTPNPPKAGQTLTIKATGDFAEQIEEGSYVMLEVKYGLIKILTLREDLCETLKNVDETCPVDKGKTVITRDVDLPQRIPPGTYTVKADVYTEDDRKITCLKAAIEFRLDG